MCIFDNVTTKFMINNRTYQLHLTASVEKEHHTVYSKVNFVKNAPNFAYRFV